jgi:hypothetical protein
MSVMKRRNRELRAYAVGVSTLREPPSKNPRMGTLRVFSISVRHYFSAFGGNYSDFNSSRLSKIKVY